MRQVDRRSLAHQAGAMSTENVSCAVRVRRRREGGMRERDRKANHTSGRGGGDTGRRLLLTVDAVIDCGDGKGEPCGAWITGLLSNKTEARRRRRAGPGRTPVAPSQSAASRRCAADAREGGREADLGGRLGADCGSGAGRM